MIYDTKLVHSEKADVFAADLDKSIAAYQEQGLVVDVQYGTSAGPYSYNYTALVVASKPGNEGA